MNKIQIQNNHMEIKEQDENLVLEVEELHSESDVFRIKIFVNASTKLELYQESLEESKLDISFIVAEGVSFQLLEVRKNSKCKIQYTYQLEAYSDVSVMKFYDCGEVKELDLIELNGESAGFSHHIKTIAKKQERFDLIVYHNAKNTTSNLYNHGVNIEEGSIQFKVTSIVYQGIKDCVVNQNNRIITLNNYKCHIEPILLIEENDVTANHAAYIGKFDEQQIFYLMSRGISRDLALQLLIKGFLLESVSEIDSIQKIIEQYWR